MQYRLDLWPASERDRLMRRVWTELQSHRGKDNAITARDLARRMDSQDRTVRKAIELLIAEESRLIGASVDGVRGGFYLIETEEELEEVRAILRARASKIFLRDGCLRRAWERVHGKRLQPLLPEMGGR